MYSITTNINKSIEYAKFSVLQVVPPKQQQIIAAVVVYIDIKGLQFMRFMGMENKNGYKLVTIIWQL